MLKTTTKTQEIKVIEGIMCDRCGRTASHYNDLEYQEFTRLSQRGGYGSIIGDGIEWSLDLCQHCLVKVFGKYIRRYDEEKNQSIFAEVLNAPLKSLKAKKKPAFGSTARTLLWEMSGQSTCSVQVLVLTR